MASRTDDAGPSSKPMEVDAIDIADAPAPTGLLDLMHELQVLVVLKLPLPSVCTVISCCRTLGMVARSDVVWDALLRRFFPDIVHVPPGQRMAAFRYIGAPGCIECPICHNTLLLPDGDRCPCVAKRTNRLPLRVGALGKRRAGTSALTSGGFSGLIDCLRAHFDLGFGDPKRAAADMSLDGLDEASLTPLDLLILCTTEGPALTADEQAALRSWLVRGGTLVVSAFSNWSAYEHYAAQVWPRPTRRDPCLLHPTAALRLVVLDVTP